MAQPLIKKDRLPVRFFIIGVSVVGLTVFAYSLYQVATAPLNAEWVLLTLVTVLLISRIDIGIPKTSSKITITDTFLFISVLLYGTFPSVVLAGLDGTFASLPFKNKRRVVPFNVAVLSLSMFVSSTVVGEVFVSLEARKTDLSLLFVAAGLLALIHYILNSGIVSILAALRRRRSLVQTWTESFLLTSLSYFAGAIAACLIIKLIDTVSFYAFIVAVPIIAITYFSYKVYLDNLDASNRHAEQVADLHLRTIEALAIAIDAKGEVSHDHVHRVQVYSTGLARIFGLSDAEIESLKAGALLHDIGKLAVPDYILNKPGPLTTAEFDKMKVHTIVGAEILERVGFPYPVVPVVRHHHERWDGRGYPDGLKGEQIPITARILAVCDCFDAVREDRQYRKAMTREQALQILREGSGTVFDPKVIGAFLEHLDEFEAEIRSMRVAPHKSEDRRAKKIAETNRLDNDHKAFERIRSANRELITLYYIAQTIGTSLDLRDTFAVFSARLEDIVSYTTCVLYLQKTESTEVEVAHVSGRNAERFKGRRMASGAGIAGWVVANRHSMHNCDPALDFDTMKIEIPEAYKTATVVPLMKDDEVLGALALYSADVASYDTDHLRLMEAVAKLASDAIANAVQHERTETSALTDVITGLPNARALRYRFEEEADRAKRHKDIFSVVMMDLDRFKSVNDQLGHQAGDHLLKELGRILLAQVRSSDFVCRYAGDEFVAILQIGYDEVQELLSRIQKTVATHDFGFGSTNVFIGLSLGAASFGTDGDTLDELLLAADRAMYADKARRKNLMNEAGTFKTSDLSQYRVM